jgi:cell division protein FtsN
MSRYAGNKSAPRNGSSQVWAGIFVGVVIGAGIAAVFSWYMMKSPSPLRQPVVMPLPPVVATTTPQAQTVSEKPRFEFYNVLTDKAQKSAAPAKQTNQEKQVAQSRHAETKPVETKPAAAYTPQILQVGSFSTAVDAEKLKARLAMIGAESHIQTANVPDRGVYYRVRLGPYKSEEELNRARNFLKQNALESTPMRAQ